MSYKLRVGRLRSLRKFRSVCRGVCAACASFAAFAGAFAQPALGFVAFAETFAQLAQVLRRLPGRLRSPHKFRGVCRSVCAARASLAAFAAAFAQLAQVLRRLPRRLRSPRKSCGVCRDVCAACAGSRGVNRKKRGNKPAKSCSLSLLPNRRMSTLYPSSSTLY